jgi:hypothetical protein
LEVSKIKNKRREMEEGREKTGVSNRGKRKRGREEERERRERRRRKKREERKEVDVPSIFLRMSIKEGLLTNMLGVSLVMSSVVEVFITFVTQLINFHLPHNWLAFQPTS